MKHLTIRSVPLALARALGKEARGRGKSLNQTVKDLLEQALGLASGAAFDNGLGKLAGTWTEDELAEFEQATQLFERIDDESWK